MLSDNKSVCGMQFIKNICVGNDYSEYDMGLKNDKKYELKFNNHILRKAELNNETRLCRL